MKKLLIAVAAIAVAACGVADSGSTTTTVVASTTTVPPSSNPLAELAVANLAQRLDIPEDDIEVVRSESVSWPNGAIGCPEPGMMYTQAIVEGFQIVLEAGDRYYDYHSGGEGPPFLCESDAEDGGHSSPPPPSGITS